MVLHRVKILDLGKEAKKVASVELSDSMEWAAEYDDSYCLADADAVVDGMMMIFRTSFRLL